MLSDEERDIDGESDEDLSQGGGSSDKRAHHNALERKRRDHIKDSFSKLRDAIPSMTGDKLSRAQILKKASDYITYMKKKNSHCQVDIDNLKSQNSFIEAQIRALEKAKTQGNFGSVADILKSVGLTDDNLQVSSVAEDDLSVFDAPANESSPEVELQPIAPGQSLLLTAVSSTEPSKKRAKVEVKSETGSKSRSFQ